MASARSKLTEEHQDEVVDDIFHHDTLPHAGEYIRLLHVNSINDDRDVPVHCTITTWAMGKAPPYQAISYTWGDSDKTTHILVNGKRLEVRQNCEFVLRQAHRYNAWRRRYVWCDAISIDQANNDEKSHQVAAMGDIYRRAKKVLACVGAHEDDSKFLLQKIRSSCRLMLTVGSVLTWVIGVKHDEDNLRFFIDTFARTHSRDTRNRMYSALKIFATRQYFRRTWVYQELFLATRVIVCCGFDFVPMHSICLSGLVQENTIGDAEPLMRAGAIRGLPKRPLGHMMQEMSSLQCQDSRDKVYGALSMIEWGNHPTIFPDYSRDRLELAVDVLVRMDLLRESPDRLQPDEILHSCSFRATASNLCLFSDPTQELFRDVQHHMASLKLPPGCPQADSGTLEEWESWKQSACHQNLWDFVILASIVLIASRPHSSLPGHGSHHDCVLWGLESFITIHRLVGRMGDDYSRDSALAT